jgi:selenocysteine-specific elongation factor
VTPKAVVLGTAGHVDHGKTALVRALTGTETDRWREEKERGLTIDIGFARLELDGGLEIGVIDVPGHEDFIKNMLAGATGIDLLLLVVAADEGPMPQTLEHLAIAKILGVENGIVALTKSDRAEPEWVELVAETTRETLQTVLGHDDWPVLPVSAVTGEGLEALREAIGDAVTKAHGKPRDDPFRLPVDRCFSIRGTGTVVTGTVWSGEIEVGDEVLVFPGNHSARVRSLEVHGETRKQVAAGRRCAMALVGVDPTQVTRGSVVLAGEGWRETRRLGVRLHVLRRPNRAVEHEQRLRVYLGTRETMARVLLLEGSQIPPGATGWAVLKLEQPIVARARDRLVLRFYSPVTTLGGGEVADLTPPSIGRCSTDLWSSVLDGPADDRLEAAVRTMGGNGVLLSELPILTGLTRSEVRDQLAAGPPGLVRLQDRWFTVRALRAAKRVLSDRLDTLQARDRRSSAVSLEALRRAGRTSGRRALANVLVDRAIQELETAGELVIEGPRVRRPGHRPDLTPEESAEKERLLSSIEAAGAEPPTIGELERQMDRALLHDLLELLVEEGHLVGLNPEMFVATKVVESLVADTRALLREGEVASPTLFKEAFGVSRKYLIPILEYLDREGVTRRTGEGRVLA